MINNFKFFLIQFPVIPKGFVMCNTYKYLRILYFFNYQSTFDPTKRKTQNTLNFPGTLLMLG